MKVASIGEILFDVYPQVKVLGGAPFNFFFHLLKLIGDASFISRIGNDSNGRRILEFFYAHEINDEFIQIDEKHPTGIVEITLNEEKVPEFNIISGSAYEFIELNGKIINLLNNNTDILYHGTLAQKGEITAGTMRKILSGKINRFCDLNLRQDFHNKELIELNLKDCNVVKINEEELKIISDYFSLGNYSMRTLSEKIKNLFNIELLCVTLGSEGAYILSARADDLHKAEADEIVDTVGAGDAYASVLCIGYLLNWEISRINKTASEFAAAACSYNGAIPSDDSFYDEFKNLIWK